MSVKAISMIIGALIGAGFASGKEIYTFFFQYGIYGIVGIFLTSILFGLIIYKVLVITLKNNIKNYKGFLELTLNFKNKSRNKKIIVINALFNILIVITFIIMIAGFGAYLEQEFRINKEIGSFILAITTFFILIKDVDKIIKISKYVVPTLIFLILVIIIFIYNGYGAVGVENMIDEYNGNNILNYFEIIKSSIIYVSYNLVLNIPVLISVKKLLKNKKQIKKIVIILAIVINLLLLSIFFILSNVDNNIEYLEMPAVYFISQISNTFKYVYGIVIIFSIITTTIALGNSFLENISKKGESNPHIVLILCIISFVLSRFGFSALLNLIYPIIGYIGIIQIFKIVTFKVEK